MLVFGKSLDLVGLFERIRVHGDECCVTLSKVRLAEAPISLYSSCKKADLQGS
jgi:hypothetical protein